MLVAAGSSLTIKDYQGNTAQALALKAGDNELSQYLESKLVDVRSINEPYLDMGLLCSLFEDTEPDNTNDEDDETEVVNDEDKTLDYPSSSTSSSEKIDEDSDTTFDQSSFSRRCPYKKMSRESFEYNFDVSASSTSTLNDKMHEVSIVPDPPIDIPKAVSIDAYTNVFVPTGSTPRIVSSSTLFQFDNDCSLAPVHEGKPLSNADLDKECATPCPDCLAEKSALRNQVNLLQEKVSENESDSICSETVNENESSIAEEGSVPERKDSVLSADLKPNTAVPPVSPSIVAPVHSRSFKSFIKGRSKKIDSPKLKKSQIISSRISQSLRSSYSIRSSKSSSNIRSLGGSMRNTWSSDHCGSLVGPSPISHLGSTFSIPSPPAPSPCASPLPPMNFSKERRASSVVLALAATQASSLALAYSSIKFPPLLTPETIAQTQAITKALTDTLIEEKRRLEENAEGMKGHGLPKRIKLERLI